MDEYFKEKSLKLLANPNKLKDSKQLLKNDTLKNEINIKFNCNISDNLYDKLLLIIKKEIIIYQYVDDIINQVIQYQSLEID